MIRFYDLGLGEPGLRADLDAAWRRVADSGWMILGPELDAFEAEFAGFCGVGHAVGVGNGYDALVLALRAADVGPGDEVIVPAHTFAATWLAVTAVGARPVPVEVDPATYTLDPAGAVAAVTSRSKAIIPVSLYGHPADMEPLMALAERHGLFVCWRTPPRAMGRPTAGGGPGRSPTPRPSASIPPRISEPWAMRVRWTTDDPALAERLRKLRN